MKVFSERELIKEMDLVFPISFVYCLQYRLRNTLSRRYERKYIICCDNCSCYIDSKCKMIEELEKELNEK